MVTSSSFAVFVTAVLWLCLVLGYLGHLNWVFDLFANFRLQYAVLFLGSALVLLFTRRPQVAVAALIGMAVTIWSVAAHSFVPHAAGMASLSLRVLTFNVWFRNQDLRPAAQAFESSGADVILLQELSAARARALGKLLPSYPYAFIGEDWQYDAVVYSRWPLAEQQLIELAPGGAHAALVTLDMQGQQVRVASVHLHWPIGARNAAMRNAELKGLAQLANSQPGPLVIGGDFNLTPWSPYYSRFVAASGLQNCAPGQVLEPTWPAQAAPLRIRIDHCFASRHWAVAGARLGPKLGSDHLPTVADLKLQR